MIDFIKENELNIKKDKSSKENYIINTLINLIKDYLSSKEHRLFEKLRDLKIDLNLKETFPSDLAYSVIEYLIQNVKYGQTTSYSEIGKAMGSKAYRAIGNILRKNPIPLIIPCHRVIRKNGTLGGFMGYSHNWHQKLKRDLLEIERIKD